MKLNPRAPQGPSDDELNRVPPDPFIPPYGGSRSLYADFICGPYMNPDAAQNTVLAVRDRKMGSFTMSVATKGY